MNVDGAVAIVTGGASGLGAATARRLAAGGASVVIADVADGDELASQIDGAYVPADVTDSDQVRQVIAVATEIGPVRVLVNCAGVGPPARTVGRDGTPMELDHFERIVRINLVGSFNAARLCGAAMAATDPLPDGGRGLIVNTASVAAYEGQIGQVAYSASKGGIVGMTLPLARDLAVIGVRVMTIAPGIMDTPLLGSLPETARASLGQQVLYPRRLGTPDEFAHLVWHIVRNDYLNGEVIRLDGGIRMQPK